MAKEGGRPPIFLPWSITVRHTHLLSNQYKRSAVEESASASISGDLLLVQIDLPTVLGIPQARQWQRNQQYMHSVRPSLGHMCSPAPGLTDF